MDTRNKKRAGILLQALDTILARQGGIEPPTYYLEVI